MSQDVRIREAAREDLERVYEIEQASFPDSYPLAFLEFLHHSNRRTFLVAERGGVVVGYVIASAERGLGHIVSIATDPTERKRTIGRKLMTAVLEVLVALGMTAVRLEVRKSNLEAQSFYECLGFQSAYTIAYYYRDEDAVVYIKPL